MHRLAVTLLCVFLLSPAVLACTGVVIARQGEVVVGGNEDWVRWDSYMWATAATESVHGVIYFGYEIRDEWGDRPAFWYEFQGINDCGLYFDSFGAPCVTPMSTLANPWRGEHLMVDAMEGCESVAEAVHLFESSDLRFMSCQQFLFVDREGNAAVVEGDETVWMTDGIFAVTNFYLSDPSLGNAPCWRYDGAVSGLAEDATPSCERIAELLEGASHPATRYSVACDLVRGVVRLYYAHNFDRWATIDVAELCETGCDKVSIQPLIADASPSPAEDGAGSEE